MSIFARGGVEFRVNGEKIVKESEAFLLTHPVNSYYITDDYDDNPIIKYGGDWKRIEAGRVLWTTTTDGEGGSLVEAGLPNITGTLQYGVSGRSFLSAEYGTGAFQSQLERNVNISTTASAVTTSNTYHDFNARRCSDIYRDDITTVQPPAVKVYIWKRVG